MVVVTRAAGARRVVSRISARATAKVSRAADLMTRVMVPSLSAASATTGQAITVTGVVVDTRAAVALKTWATGPGAVVRTAATTVAEV